MNDITRRWPALNWVTCQWWHHPAIAAYRQPRDVRDGVQHGVAQRTPDTATIWSRAN